MASGDLLKKLFRNYRRGDIEAFEAIALQIIAEEQQKNHHILAADLQKILNNGPVSRHSSILKQIPRDQESNVPLVEIRSPEKYLSDIILSKENHFRIERVIEEFHRKEILQTYGVRANTRLLFCGPPGCGKTLCAKVLSGELGLPMLYTRFDSIISSYLGQTSTNLRKVFDYASNGTWVVFFDEFDAIGKSREDLTEHGELKRVVNSFLQLLDSFSSDSLLIAATNHEGLLDRALWRRFDDVIFFDKPNTEQILSVIDQKLKGFHHNNLTIEKGHLEKLEGLPYSDIERICFDAIKEMLLRQKEQVTNREFDFALDYHMRRQKIIAKTTAMN